MKKIKNYINPELAKKKIKRYKYWNIKDECGISITSSEDSTDGRSFTEVLDSIIADNVDAEVQVKFGTNEQSSRQNAPIFIRINEEIEWVEPEEEETVQINGVPHKLDKNGNVHINLSTPQVETPIVETQSDTIRQEMEIQLEGLRKENELKEQRYQADLHNKLAEQTLKFKEMMLAERESRIAEREQELASKEMILDEKESAMSDDLRGYAKLIPSTLGSVMGDWLKSNPFKNNTGLGDVTKKANPKPRTKVEFSIDESNQQLESQDIQTNDELQEIEVIEPTHPKSQTLETEVEETPIIELENQNTDDEL